jgi:hypothetical protein
MGFESWIDRQIREAEERGEFDNLPGAGKPLKDLDKPQDADWWVKRLIARENLPRSYRRRWRFARRSRTCRRRFDRSGGRAMCDTLSTTSTSASSMRGDGRRPALRCS